MACAWPRRLAAILALALMVVPGLVGCASAPDRPPPPPSTTLRAGDASPLGRLAFDAGVPAGRSGFRPLLLSALAWQSRLELIDQAQLSIDLQTYLLGDDSTGHQISRALVRAAARGVRVRLLLDDFYTTGLTDLLLGLAAQPNVEVRLYNPFPVGRDSGLLRLASLLGDFNRLNRRMHNKLFIADGRAAIVGGRNLADAYFMRSEDANFLDFDLFCTGTVVDSLSGHFDTYWNSRFAVPVQALADNYLSTDQRRASFDVLTRARPLAVDSQAAGGPAPGTAVKAAEEAADGPAASRSAGTAAALNALGSLPLVVADAQVLFDSPDKTAGPSATPSAADGVRSNSLLLPISELLETARERVTIISPYFLPSADGLQRMRQARERGVEVQVITNSLLDSDEPLVSLAYGQRRPALLQAGVRLFELSSLRLHGDAALRRALGSSVSRLHAKLGFIDDHLLLVGSMNLDPRSASINTELALAIDSPALVRLVLGQFQPADRQSAFEVRLAADGQSLEWLGRDAQGDDTHNSEPGPSWWQAWRLWLLSRLVPDDLL